MSPCAPDWAVLLDLPLTPRGFDCFSATVNHSGRLLAPRSALSNRSSDWVHHSLLRPQAVAATPTFLDHCSVTTQSMSTGATLSSWALSLPLRHGVLLDLATAGRAGRFGQSLVVRVHSGERDIGNKYPELLSAVEPNPVDSLGGAGK